MWLANINSEELVTLATSGTLQRTKDIKHICGAKI